MDALAKLNEHFLSCNIKKHKVMCEEHKCLVEFMCKDYQKAVFSKCVIVYHRKGQSVLTLDSMIPEMKQVVQQNDEHLNSQIQKTRNTLKTRRSEVEDLIQHKSSAQSEIRRVSQQAVDLIRRKGKRLLDELHVITEKQIGEVRGQIESGENDLQTYQQYTEFIKQVLKSDSAIDLYELYTLCQSGEITAEIQRKDNQYDITKKVEFENQLDLEQIDKILQLGQLRYLDDKSNLQDTPQLLSTVSIKSKDDKTTPDTFDIEVVNIGRIDTLVIADHKDSSVKSFYIKLCIPHSTSFKLEGNPFALTRIGMDRVAVPHRTHNIELIKLTPDPVHVSSIKTKKGYRCLTALSDTTLAAGCRDPPSIDVLTLSGKVLRSVITPNNGQQLIQKPWYMCTTRKFHIVVADYGPGFVFGVTQQGEVLYTHKLTGGYGAWGGVTTTYTGSVIVADYNGNKIVQVTGEYVRDLLTGQDGIDRPQGIRVHGNKIYVTEESSDHVKIFQL